MAFQKREDQDIFVYIRDLGGSNFAFCATTKYDGQSEEPVDEYSYWYTQGKSKNGYISFRLYFEIKTGRETVYLTEEKNNQSPPEGWPISDVNIAVQPGIIQINGLEELAFRIDKLTSAQ